MITIILPAYNEEKSLPQLISQIRILAESQLTEKIVILVVDDGSTDRTAECVNNLVGNDILLVQHQGNKGLGQAIKTGFNEALRSFPDTRLIVTMDSDNTHPPSLLLPMVKAIEAGSDVVIASRYRRGARVVGLSWDRKVMSLGMSWMFRLILPIRGVRDYSCGYRVYKSQFIQEGIIRWGDQFVSQTGFSCMVEILLKLNQLHAIFYEVPLILRYDLKQGRSKMNVRVTIQKTIKLLYQERMRLLLNK